MPAADPPRMDQAAKLAGERPQQLPPIAGVALMNAASARAPTVAISNGFLMDGLPIGGIADTES